MIKSDLNSLDFVVNRFIMRFCYRQVISLLLKLVNHIFLPIALPKQFHNVKILISHFRQFLLR